MRRFAALLAVVALMTGLLAACGGGSKTAAHKSGGGSSGTSAARGGATGGSLHVLENAGPFSWNSLDPATAGAAFKAFPFYFDAIYGDLFEQGADNKPIPDLASGYSIADGGKKVTITLRHGVSFTDGTPFNAAAVKWNIERDLSPANGNSCDCAQYFPIASMTTPDPYTVVLDLTRPFSPIIESFFAEAPNWIESPTAVQKMGVKQFAQTPVGAGPFMVKQNTVGTVLELVRNPHYWAKGKPYLDSLTFSTIGSDESAYEALLAGQAQAYPAMSTLPLVQTARQHGLHVQPTAAVDPYGVQLNTTKAPFDNILAREAIYYATDPAAINKSILLGLGTVTESGTGPNGLFYEPKVPGYRTYDLAKAKALVAKLGGLNISILATQGGAYTPVATALKAEWSKAGITTALNIPPLQVMVTQLHQREWTAALQGLGSFDPAEGFGLSLRFSSTSPSSGVHDPALDALMAKGVAEFDPTARAATYRQIYKMISDKAYAPFLFTVPSYTLTVKGVSGPGLSTTAPETLWEDARVG